MLAQAIRDGHDAQPVYVSSGLAWERDERAIASRLLASLASSRPMKVLAVDMIDVYPSTHWAVRGEAPDFDTPDAAVYLEGRNIVLLSKTSVYMATIGSTRVLLGSLAGNPFPDSGRGFLDAMERALSIGLGRTIVIDAPLSGMRKAEVIRLGQNLAVPFELTLSCMQPVNGQHCGRCSKCRERLEAFSEAGVDDPASYAAAPPR